MEICATVHSVLVIVMLCVFFTEQSLARDTLTSQEIDNMARSRLLNLLGNVGSEVTTANFNNSHLRPVLDSCKAFVTEFGKHAAKFINCSVNYARPFRFCERCVEHFARLVNVYHDIEMNDEKMGNCRNRLLNSDRVQVITSIFNDIHHIWTTADCEKCFSSYNEYSNGTVHYQLTHQTEMFLNYYGNFSNCTPNDTHKTEYNATVCEDCLPYYRDMNGLFKNLMNLSILSGEKGGVHICMDIVDMMNYSRLLWGKELQCTVVTRDYAPVLSLSFVLLFTPVAFYIGMKVYGTKKERKLVTHKRLTSSQTNYGSTDNSFQLSSENDVANNDGSVGRLPSAVSPVPADTRGQNTEPGSGHMTRRTVT